MGTSVLHKLYLQAKLLPWQPHNECHFILVWCLFQVPSLKSIALTFLKIIYILLFVFSWNHWWRHQSLNKNFYISPMRSYVLKTKTPFFFSSKGLLSKLHFFLLFHKHSNKTHFYLFIKLYLSVISTKCRAKVLPNAVGISQLRMYYL